MIFPVCAKFGDIADHFVNKKKRREKPSQGLQEPAMDRQEVSQSVHLKFVVRMRVDYQ